MISTRLVDPKAIANVKVGNVTPASVTGKIRLNIKAVLLESSYSVEQVATEVRNNVLVINVTERFVMFVAKEKRRGDIEIEVDIPKEVKEVRFAGSDKPIWIRQ